MVPGRAENQVACHCFQLRPRSSVSFGRGVFPPTLQLAPCLLAMGHPSWAEGPTPSALAVFFLFKSDLAYTPRRPAASSPSLRPTYTSWSAGPFPPTLPSTDLFCLVQFSS
ncbi:unnamed protein product [Prorocentrum cordatum]|uniref:Uncharacterized protein n=1 Tax=Prorocentrum cordatum TaxID=2364126 RepID=A0ABN9X3R1_9DINO|nr:unnamed protein product [Polarella glacialis]